jgi:hypothetical protein
MLFLFLSLDSATADIIAQWNFNSVTPDSDTGTGTNRPSVGVGTATLVGGTTATYAAGSTNDPATSTDDSGWNTSHYPGQGTGNKTAGVQFNVSTLGYSNIVVRWDHKVSSSATKFCRLQYSTDGANFNDHSSHITANVVSSTGSYYEAQTNSLAAISGVNNNYDFAFRIVSEFEDTAIGAGSANYVTTFGTNSYSTSGTVRFDLVTVTGTAIPGANTPPTISTISNQTIRVNQSTGALPFSVGDAEDPATSLTMSKKSSDPAVIPDGNILPGGSGANRTVSVQAGGQTGVSIITLTVTDTGARSNSTSFAVTVLPLNTAPVISAIPVTYTLADTPTPAIDFTVDDLETASGSLIVSGSSSNPGLVPNGNIVFGGSDANRTVTITPASGQTGVAIITVNVSDGTNSAASLFPLMVLASADSLLYEPFNYDDGSVLTNSAFLWSNSSGNIGECQVTNGQLQLSSSLSEDVTGDLVGGPYVRSNSTVLYASFKFTALGLPKNTPDYFAHFVGSGNRGRIYAGTTNASSGAFHLFLSNGNTTNPLVMFPSDLLPDNTYSVVTRYDIDSATTELWLDPASESDPSVTADDLQSAITISAWGFRESSSVGTTVLIDDLRVGLSFASVVPTGSTLIPIPLIAQRIGNQIRFNWNDPTFVLQSAPAVSGIYTNIPGASSPFTNTITGGAKFFRLKSN